MAKKLPFGISNEVLQNPRQLIIFSKPKVGKTTAISQLPDNLIIDLESGTDYIGNCIKQKAKNMKELGTIYTALQNYIKENGEYPYEFITLDTATALEDMVKPAALKDYQNTPAGANYKGDILAAPNGSGYGFVRNVIEKVLNMFQRCTPNLILIAHSKDSAITKENLTLKEVDLSGKSGRVIASKTDAIGFLTRDENSNTVLSFNVSAQDFVGGARPAHLSNKEIVIGEMDQATGELKFYWERIYPEIGKDKTIKTEDLNIKQNDED